MKRNIVYTSVVFAVVFSWIAASAITQTKLGILERNDLNFALGASIAVAAVAAGIFFAVFRAVQIKSQSAALNSSEYRPSKRFAIVSCALLAASVSVSTAMTYNERKNEADSKQAQKEKIEAAKKAAEEREAAEQQRLAAMTPEEREAEAKAKEEQKNSQIVQNGEALLQRWREREAWASASLAGKNVKEPDVKPVMKQEWSDMQTKLRSIPESQSQYKKAQQLLAAMDAEDKKAAAAVAALRAATRLEKRKSFASKLEESFLEKRMDTDVTASGPRNTVLRIKWVLASKVTANDLRKSGLIDEAEKAGFKKVILTDGYDSQWWWDLSPEAD